MRENWLLAAWGVGIAGVVALVFILFLGVQWIRAASAFYDTARATILGTVQESHMVTNPCVNYIKQNFDTCPQPTYCQATVMFTPLGQHRSFTLTTTADHCEMLPKGALVEILYDPRNPKTAETPDQASGDVVGAVGETLGWLLITALIVLVPFAWVMGELEKTSSVVRRRRNGNSLAKK